MGTGLTESALRRLYTDLGKTDIEIAEFFGVDRTSIVKLRTKNGITTRKTIGEIGEEMVWKELKSRGYLAENMNDVDKLHPFDILVDGWMRVEVKSASSHKGRFHFTFTEKESNQNIESEYRFRLKCGRTKKDYNVTCDVMVLVGIEGNGDCHFFINLPSKIPREQHGISAPVNPFSPSKYEKWRENWGVFEQIKKPDVGASDSE